MKKTVDHFTSEAAYLSGKMGIEKDIVDLAEDDSLVDAWGGRRIYGFKVTSATDHAPLEVPSHHIWRKVIMSWLGIMAVLWFAYPLGFMVLAAGTLVMTVILVKLG
jgi:hypothetical protein